MQNSLNMATTTLITIVIAIIATIVIIITTIIIIMRAALQSGRLCRLSPTYADTTQATPAAEQTQKFTISMRTMMMRRRRMMRIRMGRMMGMVVVRIKLTE